MTFGKADTLLMIEKALQQSEEEAYEPLCEILYRDIKVLINKYCRDVYYDDREDLLQECVSKVILNLPRFYKNSQQLTEAERNAWLREIVINTRNDYFRKLCRKDKKDSVEYCDALEQPAEQAVEKKIEARDSLFEILSYVFSIDTSPETMLAFVYNNLLDKFSNVNGSPKELSEEFHNMSLDEIYEKMVCDLSDILECNIPNHVLKPLRDKVNHAPGKRFFLSPRCVTERSNWIVKKVKEQL